MTDSVVKLLSKLLDSLGDTGRKLLAIILAVILIIGIFVGLFAGAYQLIIAPEFSRLRTDIGECQESVEDCNTWIRDQVEEKRERELDETAAN